jgi:hypothetical protein
LRERDTTQPEYFPHGKDQHCKDQRGAGVEGVEENARRKTDKEITIVEIKKPRVDWYIVGTTRSNSEPHEFQHGELLFPSPRKNAAEKAANLKHYPKGNFATRAE